MAVENIVVFGASGTFGFVDESEKGGWLGRLKQWFEMKNPEDNRVYNLAISGDTTVNLLKRMQVELEARFAGIIIIEIGANDASRRPRRDSPCGVSIEDFENNLNKIIGICKKFTSKIVFIGLRPHDEKRTTPVPWGPFYFDSDIRQYDNKLKEVCQKRNVLFLDQFSKWKSYKLEKLYYDGLHPNTKGHEIIFENVKEFLIKNKLV